MIVDTSAWIEYLRATGSHTHLVLRQTMQDRSQSIVSPDIVVAELTAGARNEPEAQRLTRMLFSFEVEPLAAHDDALEAAALYRRCRAQGMGVRSITDCLIAAVALRLGEPILCRDRDFDKLAEMSDLKLV